MSTLPSLDADLLRTFVFIAEGRSFTRAAAMVGRTQAAVSMQVKRLEEVLGQEVLQRSKGGSVELTPHGEYLLGRARRILALNDEVISTFRAPELAGQVRLGTPDDYAFRFLPEILRRFAETHPAVEVSVLCLPSSELSERLKADDLDLTLVSEGSQPRGFPATPLMRGPLIWVTSTQHAPHRRNPIPLALAHDNCTWRAAALRALDRAGKPYRVAYTSGTQVGTHAPVLAGLAVTVSALSWLPPGLRPLRADEGMPPLPDFGIQLVRGLRPLPVADALATHIEESFRLDGGRSDERPLLAAE